MSDETTKFKLDLDAAAFIAEGNKAQGVINKLGSKENMSELIEGLEHAGAIVGVLGAAFFAVKEAFELVFDAEKIKGVNAAFELLSENANVFSEDLKKGLVESSKGFATEVEVMEAANKSMLKLDAGVKQLPQLLDLARKSASIMGGDMLEKFELLGASIASGNQRGLKQAGIILDINKSYREYAASIGVSVDALSAAGKQQALMNAVLEKGNEKLGDINGNLKPATNNWKQFKATLSEIGEIIAIAFDHVAGPSVARSIETWRKSLGEFKTYLVSVMGEGSEQSAAKVELLNKKIAETKDKLDQLESKKGIGATLAPMDAQLWIQQYNKDLVKLQAELDSANVKNNKFIQDSESKKGELGEEKSSVDSQKAAEERAKYNKELATLDEQLMNERIKKMQTTDEAQSLYDQKRLGEASKISAEIDVINARAAKGEITKAQANEEVARLHQISNLKMQKSDADLRKMEDQALDNYLKKSTGTFDGVARGFEVMSKKNQNALKDWGAYGERTSKSFEVHSVDSIKAWGAGQKSATDAAASLFGGMVGDMATDYGKMMLLSSVWPPNPAGIAAGTALIALGGYLGTLGNGGSPAGDVGGSGGAIQGGGLGADSTGSPMAQAANQTQTSKSVSLVIQGNMLTDQQTARWLVDQVRAAADATDYKIQSIGGGL